MCLICLILIVSFLCRFRTGVGASESIVLINTDSYNNYTCRGILSNDTVLPSVDFYVQRNLAELVRIICIKWNRQIHSCGPRCVL